ncbi:5-guanidino-2-oxopentanoate decarboxylase [Solirhodobacter olei]|uniref:5-guanidino-2-oxopentanoate decarboxylase n=1 Tax=Solirhodobacter olei TaxID=2493082 RepID=UPI000FDC7280|nr:5-guanidino-2-oxopentanoate decarboxylase [Solirhodobacter olei]
MASIGEALVRGLKARGVEVVFGIPGVHTIELYRGLPRSGIRHVTPRHEGAAAFMADGYARISGKPGVAFVITGPGLTNALTPMAQARADSVPVLVVSGANEAASTGRGLGYLHELPDQLALARTVAVFAEEIGEAAALAPALEAGFAALQGRGGPVHLQVPTNVMPLPCPDLPAPGAVPAPAAPDPAAVAEAVARLGGAKRPVILAGGGAKRAEAALRAVAEALDAPVVETANARGLMHRHPLVVPASPSLEAVRALIAEADAVLAVGTELGLTDYDMYRRGGLPDLSSMVRIDVDGLQLARHPAGVAICADAGAALAALAAGLTGRAGDGVRRAQAARQAARAELSPGDRARLEMLEAIRAALPGAIVVGDSTQPVYAGNLYYDHDRPGGWFNAATGFGALGYGPPAAIGAAVAAPQAPVVCLTGDGGLQFSLAELMTAMDEGVDVTFVVWNNHGYREIAEAMSAAGTEVLGCDPTPPLFEPMAAAARMPFVTIPATPDALAAALRAPRKGPRMIEVKAG